MAPYYRWGSTASRLQSHYREAVHFLPLTSKLGNNTTEQFELQTTNSYENLKIIKILCNNYSSGYKNPIFLIKPVAEYISSLLVLITNNQTF